MRMSILLRSAGVVLTLLAAGCSSKRDLPPGFGKGMPMGSPAVAGNFSYTAVHTAWLDSIETSQGTKLPKNRFLVIDLEVTNRAKNDADVPAASLVDSNGNYFQEQSQMGGFRGWFGVLRPLDAGQTTQGKIVFDVPVANYQLKVVSGGDPEKETVAYIDLPVRVDPQQSVEESLPTPPGSR